MFLVSCSLVPSLSSLHILPKIGHRRQPQQPRDLTAEQCTCSTKKENVARDVPLRYECNRKQTRLEGLGPSTFRPKQHVLPLRLAHLDSSVHMYVHTAWTSPAPCCVRLIACAALLSASRGGSAVSGVRAKPSPQPCGKIHHPVAPSLPENPLQPLLSVRTVSPGACKLQQAIATELFLALLSSAKSVKKKSTGFGRSSRTVRSRGCCRLGPMML